jgi:hypothetical protein
MNLKTDEKVAERLEILFCRQCVYYQRRCLGQCPKGQTTCGAKITATYQLTNNYSRLTTGTIVHIKDIFWSLKNDYATVTVTTAQDHRFGVAWTLLREVPLK